MRLVCCLLLGAATVGGVWLAAPERIAAGRTRLGTEPARRGQGERGIRAPHTEQARESALPTSPEPAGLGCEEVTPAVERERLVRDFYLAVEAAAEAHFRRGEFEIVGPDDAPSPDRILYVRRAPSERYERVELAPDDHPELYALRARVQARAGGPAAERAPSEY